MLGGYFVLMWSFGWHVLRARMAIRVRVVLCVRVVLRAPCWGRHSAVGQIGIAVVWGMTSVAMFPLGPSIGQGCVTQDSRAACAQRFRVLWQQRFFGHVLS